MVDVNEILAPIRQRDQKELDDIKEAFLFAKEAHKDQKRYSGDPYFIHPVAAAKMLADIQMDTPTIIATLLHDVCEDGHATPAEIKKKFGDEVAFLVEGVTKLGTVKYKGIERHVENLRKMFLSMAEDIRVIIIKLADRTNNMQTLDSVPEHKRQRIALETLEVYVPLADRLGMGSFKGMLEDLAFKYVYPEDYAWTKAQLTGAKHAKEGYLTKVKEKILDELTKNNINVVKIDSRVKNLYSIYKKLLQKDRDIERIYDTIAVRIITKNIEDCYSALGIIHRLWKPVPGKIKDYIALPKPNGYQSIHTTVFCIDGKITEFQIRTEKMHEEAENGIVAHWAYAMSGKRKEGVKVNKDLSWVSELRDWQKEHIGTQEFLDSLKIDIFKDRIFVFTPKGDVIDLPEGATPLDFAYSIHSDIGNKCTGARVNAKMVSLDYKLKNGEICEIITAKNKKPSRDWLELVKTSYAKSRIRSYLKKELGIEVPIMQSGTNQTKHFELNIVVSDRVGMLKDILAVFNTEKININDIHTDMRDRQKPLIILVFPTKSNLVADKVAQKIEKIKGVKSLEKTLLRN
ncbi:bifunctional (p)ppGpp synthetase/guanosine-3',5'-bis(diphosphate) 3'-pyrophosphohydrolase [Candidatus Azambacteria bacterium]|nr:bifunctional (p)ppGpp synthetase/guanosine-3',5'-bis(diphosphate) 3'-pyrophosphohydrolase [Candidatus Azambacteria bacterium]